MVERRQWADRDGACRTHKCPLRRVDYWNLPVSKRPRPLAPDDDPTLLVPLLRDKPEIIRLASYGAVLRELGIRHRRQTARWSNNRAENSRQPVRRRKREILRFRRMRVCRDSLRSTLPSPTTSIANDLSILLPLQVRPPPCSRREARPLRQIRNASPALPCQRPGHIRLKGP